MWVEPPRIMVLNRQGANGSQKCHPVEINGRNVLQLEPGEVSSEKPVAKYIYFVDPKRGFSITRVVQTWNDKKLWQLDISHREHFAKRCWMPTAWKLRHSRSNSNFTVENAQTSLNVEFASDQFLFEFPKHTLITDRTFTKPLVYLLQADGRKHVISSAERRNGIQNLNYLSASP